MRKSSSFSAALSLLQISMEEKNGGGKRKTTPSIPANYVSILQLQERWVNEKERKQKEEKEEEEEEERRRKQQQIEEQRRIEEDLKKSEVNGKREETHLDRSNRKHRKSKKKESIDGGEAEKEEPAAIGSEIGDDAVLREKGVSEKKRRFRKRYDSRKKKNQHVAVTVKEDIVECGSIATENNTPVKDEIRVYREKEEIAKGNGPREKTAVTDSTAVETQFENLSIKRGESQTRWSNRNRINQRHVRIGAASTMVWVKKEQNERAGDGIGNGVKPSNA